MEDKEATAVYLSDRQIPELFQTLLIGIVLNQPDDPVQYLISCLDHVRDIGMRQLYWDAFAPLSRENAGPLPPLRILDRVNDVSGKEGPPVVSTKPDSVDSEPTNHEPSQLVVETGQGDNEATTQENAMIFVTARDSSKSHDINEELLALSLTYEDDNPAKQTVDATQAKEFKYNQKTRRGGKNNRRRKEMEAQLKTDQQNSQINNTVDNQSSGTRDNQRSDTLDDHSSAIADNQSRNKEDNQWNKDAYSMEPNDASDNQEFESQNNSDHTRQLMDRQESDTVHERMELLRRPGVMDVLRGSIQDLPHLPSNTVRIFLSSTFSDFKAERNILPRLAYPKLRDFCSELGLDFQVVDMRWGVTDELMNDHQVSELCIKEIKICQQVSCGPSFVTMLGDRYGFRPFPAKIPCNEYDLLQSIAEKEDITDRDVVTEWYRRDDNSVPPEYILQPIASKLLHYYDTEPEQQSKRKTDRDAWQSMSQTILRVLRICAQKAKVAGQLHAEETDKYFISVTEDEIRTGFLDLEHTRGKALCFHRHLQGVENDDKSPKRWRFVDLMDNEKLDEEAKEYRTKLAETRVPSKVSEPEQLTQYQLHWKGVPIEESDDEEYARYLEQFAADFVAGLTHMISKDQNPEAGNTDKLYKSLYHEVLYHSRFAQMKSQLFCGRREALDVIQNYMKSTTSRPPLIISGKSGYGKTALLTYAAKLLPKLSEGESTNLVMRFLGTSPQSSNILALLRSVIHHLCILYEWNFPSEERLSKIGESRRYLWLLLSRVQEQAPNTKLILLLDSIDQLSNAFNSHSMTWLPKILPPNVYIVVTMLSDRYMCLENSRRRFPDHSFFHELAPLSTDNGLEIINAYMSANSRTLTLEQKNLVCESFEKVSQPLFLKLVLDSAAQWNSYDPLHLHQVPNSVHDAIVGLFDDIEIKYGKVFVTRALGYLTSGHIGLSGLELEDILSCDDDVLNEVYKYHDPPLSGTIRLPSLLWARLEDEMKEYLAQRQMDGKTVMTWYHRQFWEAAEYRYLADDAMKKCFHMQLAELYQQDTGIRRTITLHQRGGKTIDDADRRVTPQPYNVSNLRKLNCLPYHLFHSGDLVKLKCTCLVSFKFLYTKLQAVGIATLHYEYEEFCQKLPVSDSDITLINNFLEISHDSLKFDTALFAYSVIDKIGPLGSLSILMEMFLDDARTWIRDTTTPFFLPTHPIQSAGLDSPLKFSLMCGQEGVLTANEETVVCSWTDHSSNVSRLQTLKLNTKDIMATIPLSKLSPVAVTPDNNYCIYIDQVFVYVAEIETGEIYKQMRYTKGAYDVITPRCITISDNGMYIAICVRLGKPKNVNENDIWRQLSRIAVLNLHDSNQQVTEVDFRCRKHIESLIFVNDGTELLAIARPKICKYAIPSLDMVHQYEKTHGIYGNFYAHVPQESSILLTSSQVNGIKAMYYNYNDHTCILSPHMQISDKEDLPDATVFPYGVACRDSSHHSIIGIAVHSTEITLTKLLYWDIKANTFEGYVVGDNQRKVPSCLVVRKSSDFAFIGWRNGDISVFDMYSKKEVSIKGHGAVLNSMVLYRDDSLLVSFGQDHVLKVWDVVRLIDTAQRDDGQESVASKEEQIDWDHPEGLPPGYTRLHQHEQCLSTAVTDRYVLTAPPYNVVSHKFWRLEDGNIDQELNKTHNIRYKKSLDERGFAFFGKSHADIMLFNDTIIYMRKKRNAQMIFTSKGIESPVTINHQCIADVFFALFPAIETQQSLNLDVASRHIVLVKDGSIEIRDVHLSILHTIEIPKISDDVNVLSNTGKRKLIYYRIAMTFDGKYFLVANPAARGKNKYLDLVDMENKHYNRRISMDPRTNWKILQDAFYYLIWKKGQDDCVILPPSKVQGLIDCDYKCILYTSYSFLSEDMSIGAEYARGHCIRLWQTSPLKRLHMLSGHNSDLSSVCFSYDNRFVASGSFDHTIRLWSVESGQQVALFHVFGGVDDVKLTRNMSHAVVHCYSAPQRKKVVVLKTYNMS